MLPAPAIASMACMSALEPLTEDLYPFHVVQFHGISIDHPDANLRHAEFYRPRGSSLPRHLVAYSSGIFDALPLHRARPGTISSAHEFGHLLLDDALFTTCVKLVPYRFEVAAPTSVTVGRPAREPQHVWHYCQTCRDDLSLRTAIYIYIYILLSASA